MRGGLGEGGREGGRGGLGGEGGREGGRGGVGGVSERGDWGTK